MLVPWGYVDKRPAVIQVNPESWNWDRSHAGVPYDLGFEKKWSKKNMTWHDMCTRIYNPYISKENYPHQKLRWQWKIHHLKMYFLLNMVIFQPVMFVFGSVPFVFFLDVGFHLTRNPAKTHGFEPNPTAQPSCVVGLDLGGQWNVESPHRTRTSEVRQLQVARGWSWRGKIHGNFIP